MPLDTTTPAPGGTGPAAALASALLLAGCVNLPGARPVAGTVHLPDRDWSGAPAPDAATVPLTVDNNRLFVRLTFRRADGSARPALAWVNMGMGGLSVTPALRKEIGGDGSVRFDVGGLPVLVDAAGVLEAPEEDFAQQLGPLPVEATLPAGVLSQFCVRISYKAQQLGLSRRCSGQEPGVPVPVRVSKGTGIVSVEATVAGRTYPLVVDTGAGYTWLRGEVVRGWVQADPSILRAEGAVGESNQAMVDRSFEQEATVVRVPVMRLGPLEVRDAGVLGSGPASGGLIGPTIGRMFWNAWSKGAAEDVAGWIGGNVLRDYELTIDYERSSSRWNQVGPARTDDLHSVGLSLVHSPTGYTVGGLVRAAGRQPPAGIEVGDTLVAVNGRPAAAMTRGAVLSALHGTPGERRTLTLERSGRRFDVEAAVGQY